MKFSSAILVLLLVLPTVSHAKRRPSSEPVSLKEVHDSLDKIEAELEVIRDQQRMLAQQKKLGYLDRFYLKAGLSMISPRQRTFDFNAQTGIGGFLGIGHYFGRNHAADLSFDWDLYPAVSIKYRFELHTKNNSLTFAPVLGFKTRAAELRPLDDFLEKPDQVKSSFWIFGFLVGFPLDTAMVTLELNYLTNRQAFLFFNGAVHFFL